MFQSSLVQNNLDESKKYLKILETNQKYRYSTKRAQIIVLLRGNEVEIAKNLLILQRISKTTGFMAFDDLFSRKKLD